MRIFLAKTNTFRLDDTAVLGTPRNLVVWWYGPIFKNNQALTVPKIVIFFRELNEKGELGRFIQKETAMTHLGLLRIGSVWSAGVSTSQIELKRIEIPVSFSESDWELMNSRDNSPFSNKDDYPLKYTDDRNWLLNFHLKNGKNVLIPCMEFLIRYYGRSAEAPRILTTYPWNEAESRLFLPSEEIPTTISWPIKLGRRLNVGDAIFVAHTKYDNYTKKVAQELYAQVEAKFGNHDDKYCFLKVRPWFQGMAKLRLEGMTINNGQTFLALRIKGGSQPQGPTVTWDKEEQIRQDETELSVPNEEEMSGNHIIRRLTDSHDPVELTDQQEPDRGSASLDVDEDNFAILGMPRSVARANRTRSYNKSTSSEERVIESNEGLFSTGDEYGTGKRIGFAAVHAPAVLESSGILHDMWNALLYLMGAYQETIHAVEWFTFDDDFRSASNPKLITLVPFENEDSGATDSVRKWVYLDQARKSPRGILVIRVKTDAKTFYILEIQRAVKDVNKEDGELEKKEESFTGMVFTITKNDDLFSWISSILNNIRYAKGVFYKLTKDCPGFADTFKHNHASDEAVPCEAAVRNAMRKVDVHLR